MTLKKCYTVTLYTLVLLSLVVLCSTFRRTPIGIGFIVPRALAQNTVQLACPNAPNVQIISSLTFRTSIGLFNWGCYDSNGNLFLGNRAYISSLSSLASAISSLPVSGGIVDASSLTSGTLTTDALNASPNIKLILGTGTFTETTPQTLGPNSELICAGRGATILQNTVNVITGGGGTVGDVLHVNGSNIYIGHCTLRGAAGTTPTQTATLGGAKGIFWAGASNNVIIDDNQVDQLAERAIQDGFPSTGVRIYHSILRDIGDEVVLFSPASTTLCDIEISDNEMTAFNSMGIDSNCSGMRARHNYIHDSGNPTVGGLGNAAGINISTLPAVTPISGFIIDGNTIVNLFPGVIGCISLGASDGTTLQGGLISNNFCSSTTAGQFATYYQPTGVNQTGIIQGIETVNNFGLNASIYSKKIQYSGWTNNTTISTLSDSFAGLRIDGTPDTGVVLSGNISTGWQTGCQTGFSSAVMSGNICNGRTTDWSNSNTAQYVALGNITPNTAGLNGIISLPETNNTCFGSGASQETLCGLTGHAFGVNPNNSGSQTIAQLNFTLGSFTQGGLISPGGINVTGSSSNGHMLFSGPSLSAGALSSCGTSPTINGTDSAGTITVGSAAGTTCVLTFANAWGTAPSCVVTDDSAIVAIQGTTTTTTLTLTGSAALTGAKLTYHCASIS